MRNSAESGALRPCHVDPCSCRTHSDHKLYRFWADPPQVPLAGLEIVRSMPNNGTTGQLGPMFEYNSTIKLSRLDDTVTGLPASYQM